MQLPNNVLILSPFGSGVYEDGWMETGNTDKASLTEKEIKIENRNEMFSLPPSTTD